MELNYRKLGTGHPLIILHGLYGSGDNWLSIAKDLSGLCEVYLIDQRNHGNSPHLSEHDYISMMNDLKDFMVMHDLSKAIILGHSMGGKVAMRFAMDYSHMITKLIIVDISPGSYLNNSEKSHVKLHRSILKALEDIDLSKVNGLSDAEEQLKPALEDERLRKFLMKNLGKGSEGKYYWKINLKVLSKSLELISGGLDMEMLNNSVIKNIPVLFIKGERSDYIGDDDKRLIKQVFPHSQMVTLKNAGHWLHAEQPDRFSKIVKTFILN